MMKIYGTLLAILLGSFPLQAAAPYNHLQEVAQRPADFLADKILHTDQITYCVEIPPHQNDLLKPEHIDLFIQASLREWTYGIALQIRQAGRAEEFADIISILEKPLTLIKWKNCPADVTAPHPDISFLISQTQCEKLRHEPVSFFSLEQEGNFPFICIEKIWGSNPLRTFSDTEYLPRANTDYGQKILRERYHIFETIAAGGYTAQMQQALWETDRFFFYDEDTISSIILHEVGHAFGLGDEYLPTRPTSYASAQAGQGIMRHTFSPIGCDEIDGIITLLDRLRNQQRTFQSFCQN